MSYSNDLAGFGARLRRMIRIATSEAGVPGMDEPSFDQLARELFRLQFAQNTAYRCLCEAREVRPDDVEHWRDIPAVPTMAFKEWDLSCLPAGERTAVFHSSGTTGPERSRHFHSRESLAVYEASLLGWFGANVPAVGGRWLGLGRPRCWADLGHSQ